MTFTINSQTLNLPKYPPDYTNNNTSPESQTIELPSYSQTIEESQPPPKYVTKEIRDHRDEVRESLLQGTSSSTSYVSEDLSIRRMLDGIVDDIGFEESLTSLNISDLLDINRNILDLDSTTFIQDP